MSPSRWNLLAPAPDEFLADAKSFSPLIAQILYNRGLIDPAAVELFMAGDERLSSSPSLLPDMDRAVSRIYRALLSSEKIAVYGDFDVDGVTSTALMVQGLSALGGLVIPYIPHRISEGHGLRRQVIEELRDQGVSLIITVDCGITDLEEVKHAAKLKMDVVITDHHTPPSVLPDAYAVVDPKLPGSQYPFTELAGVGVAYKVMQALLSSVGKEACVDNQMDLVAIGTVADMVPLVGENRYLVKRGLRTLNASPRLGVNEIITRAGLTPGELSSDSITWCLSPWLNASGRLEHAIASYNLLTTPSLQEARTLAELLGQQNAERQKLTAKAMVEARGQIASRELAPLIMLSYTEFPLGVAGPVAGKLAEEYYRPVIIVNIDDKTASGSCRSVPEFNIINALNQCAGLLSRFGGHAQAAGFTIASKNLPLLEKTLIGIAEDQLKAVDLRPRLDIDAQVSLPDLAGNTYRLMQRLAPFGKGNPVPTFLSRDVEVAGCRTMGNGQQHLRLRLRQHGINWDGVAFNQADCLHGTRDMLDIVFNLEVDRWGGAENLRLNILSFLPSSD